MFGISRWENLGFDLLPSTDYWPSVYLWYVNSRISQSNFLCRIGLFKLSSPRKAKLLDIKTESGKIADL